MAWPHPSTDWPRFSAVIFDMDGLVIDSEPTYRAAWQAAGANLGYPISNTLARSFVGKSYDRIEANLLKNFGQDFPLQRFRELSAQSWHQSVERKGLNVKPGLHLLLDTLDRHNLPYCLATNSERGFASKCLNYAGLTDTFPVCVTRDQVVAPKPAPDLFLAAAAKLGIPAQQCMVLEDSETGARAALDAGATVILIPEPGEQASPLGDRVFAVMQSLSDLNQILDRHLQSTA